MKDLGRGPLIVCCAYWPVIFAAMIWLALFNAASPDREAREP